MSSWASHERVGADHFNLLSHTTVAAQPRSQFEYGESSFEDKATNGPH